MLTTTLEKQLELFEKQWNADDAFAIEALVKDVEDSLRLELLAELVMIDIELRWQGADDPVRSRENLIEYFRRFPELAASATWHAKVVDHWKSIQNHRDNLDDVESHTTEVTHDTSATIQAARFAELRPPCQLGKFLLKRVIGEGGMGIVYEAVQREPERTVAVKVLHPGVMSDDDAAARFRREIDLVSSIEDAGVVPVYEAGSVDGYRYYVMPLLQGGTLQQRIHEGQLSTRDSARILRDLVRSVTAAHEREIVHRDLKPGNVLFGADGRAQITDFGLSRHIEESHTITRTGQICGTPGYLAPERLVFGGHKVDERPGDIYSLGAILYDMLCGRPPYRGGTVWETFSQSMSDPPVPPTRLNPDVDRDLNTICLKCLEQDPHQRYVSCDELRLDLDRYLAGESIRARRPSRFEQSIRVMRRHPARSGLTSACIALVLFALFAWLMALRLSIREQELANQQMLHRGEAYLARIAQADVLLSNREVGWRQQGLTLLEEAAAIDFPKRDNVRLRNLVATTAVQRDIQPIATLSVGMWCDVIEFDPTGRYLALGQNRDTEGFVVHIYRVDHLDADPYCLWIDCAAENERRRQQGLPRAEDGARALRFSPDGERLSIGTRHGNVHIYRWTGQEAIHSTTVAPDPGVEVFRLDFSAQGDSLWALSDKNKLRVIRNGQVECFDPIGDSLVNCIALSPVDDALFAALNKESVCRFELDATEPTWQLSFENPHKLAVSRDGRFLAVSVAESLRFVTVDARLGTHRATSTLR